VRSVRRVVLAAALAATVFGTASLWIFGQSGPDGSATFSVTGRPIARIAPGTVIGDRAPDGWSHLVFKSSSKLASGSVDSLPDFAKMLAEFLFTTMVARVRLDPQAPQHPFRLDAVAMGLGVRIGRDDVVISSDTQERLGAGLGPFKKAVLSRAEEHLDKIRLVAVSDVCWIIDAPSVLFVDGVNRNVVLRYALLVHPPNGQLASLVWRVDLRRDGSYARAVNPAVLIQSSLVGLCPLHVDGRRIVAGIPMGDAFGATRLPQGASIEIAPKNLPTAGRQRLTAEAARALDAALRDQIAFADSK